VRLAAKSSKNGKGHVRKSTGTIETIGDMPAGKKIRRRKAPEKVMGRKTVRSLAARRDTPGLACDLADLVHNLVKDLFDPYRHELHYMRGPGPKWRAKHERALRIDPDVLALTPARLHHAYIYVPEERAIRGHDRALVLRLAVFVITLLINAVTVSKTDASYCGQGSELAAARVRWAAARQSRVDPAHNEQKCRAWGIHFYDAVTARQAASVCEDGSDRQRDLDLLDSEIDAFNNLIAAQCGG